jgi:hypothetical protein
MVKLDDPEAVITYKITKREKTPKDISCYTQPNQVSAYWLFIKDIQKAYKLRQGDTITQADKLWPDSLQRSTYRDIAKGLKNEIRTRGWAQKKPADALSNNTREGMNELLGFSSKRQK